MARSARASFPGRPTKLAAKQGLALVEDEALLAENAGLSEWPVVLMGAFDESFLEVPPEVLATSMKAHQKCFSLRRGEELANRFIMVANLEAADGGKAIVAGNERVIRARLADAKFFFDHDRKVMLEDRVPKLREIVFHDKLGTQYERVQRVRLLAREVAPLVGADPDLAERAAILAKADLTSDMVGEFPELQGVMGRYYALDQEENPVVADAIAAHYKPLGPSDQVPPDPVAIAVALADKLDTLVGFWAIDEKPTGSKDPYALRRAALGVIRIILERQLSSEALVDCRALLRQLPRGVEVEPQVSRHQEELVRRRKKSSRNSHHLGGNGERRRLGVYRLGYRRGRRSELAPQQRGDRGDKDREAEGCDRWPHAVLRRQAQGAFARPGRAARSD